MPLRKRGLKVYVAMSGGVDSSVAALLLKKRGFDVVGVFMKPWQPVNDNNDCFWKDDREFAMRAAAAIGIPFKTWDFSRDYKKEVADYMISEYRAGRTPNPDVACNREIKFGLFLRAAIKEGADFIATGHYARIKKSGRATMLLAGKDLNKDQSYFLWTLNQSQLARTIFPIGHLKKSQVRQIAKVNGLPNHDKKDSQGVCFIGPIDMKSFLKKYIKPKAGKIIDRNGLVVGSHDGSSYYTIGQRHGLDIKNGHGPYYVISKDVKKNIVYVGSDSDLLSLNAQVRGINWITGVQLPTKVSARLRYRSKLIKSTLDNKGNLKLNIPERAVAPGQSVVFYRGGVVLGGGILI